jgi:hypothetical protein
VVTDQLVRLQQDRGVLAFPCPVCATQISLTDAPSRSNQDARARIPEIDRSANAERNLQTAASTLQGKEATHEFDVFLAHNSGDKPEVVRVADALRRRGLNPWLDKEQVAPGRWFQDVIQQAIPYVKSAAVFIGRRGVGKWEKVELRSFISKCVESDLPVIPVLLPGVQAVPDEFEFLKELNWVKFDDVADVGSLDDLEWGITGRKPR